MSNKTQERTFQNEVIAALQDQGWLIGQSRDYDRERGLYPQDLLHYVQTTQPEAWQKYQQLYPQDTETYLLKQVVKQLEHPNKGTLGVLRREIKDRGVKFKLCQFMPEHDLNPALWQNYRANRLRVVPELVYSPHGEELRIDLVCFVNGLPVVTMELKSEFKQAVQRAILQYRTTRLPHSGKRKEPLLTFKRGALVHFAVSQYEVYMTTHLQGKTTVFLPFNKGTHDGGAGNDIPADPQTYATAYLWQEVLQPDALLNVLGHFVHLQQDQRETPEGRKYTKESLIFPRYHQWDVVRQLLHDVKTHGSGQKYLIQHSAGSGKSNSIAWTAHQLASLYRNGEKCFASVIVITDRTVLDRQLQNTISQFEQVDGIVGRINREEGSGSKAEKLAEALTAAQPIIIVTLQTFPFVLDAIANDSNLKQNRYAIIADEAHSSQTGSTARQIREVLMHEGQPSDTAELDAEDVLQATLAARQNNPNLSYFAFTATPKSKTLELFGRLPQPQLPPSADNKPAAFHVYTMRQAIEEGFILDVLQNYTSYKVIYNLALKAESSDHEVDAKRAKIKLTQWTRLHEHNIGQKVALIIEHFKHNVSHLLAGNAKAMVVTSSRKEAVRYKHAFDQYIRDKNYAHIHAMVAFSGEVQFGPQDPQSAALLNEKFTEQNMNPNLKGREMRTAFDSSDYQVMIVANKFQTGFDQPKLCAMYVDKKLGGVDCVQTLSRLNRTYPGKADSGTFILDFVNEPEDILAAFQPYYERAELMDVSDPNLVYELSEKIQASPLIVWSEVKQFATFYFDPNTKAAAVANVCRYAVDRWNSAYRVALENYQRAQRLCALAKVDGNTIDQANAEQTLKTCRAEKEALDIFKKDLGSFVRFYEFMSQIVDYNDMDLEKLALYARHLRPLLREVALEEEQLDLSAVQLTGYNLLESQREQHLQLKESEAVFLEPGTGMGSAQPKDKQAAFLSEIIQRLNDLFAGEDLNTNFPMDFTQTVIGQIRENPKVVDQIKHNSFENAMLGDFPREADDAIMESADLSDKIRNILLGNEQKSQQFYRIIYDMFKYEELR